MISKTTATIAAVALASAVTVQGAELVSKCTFGGPARFAPVGEEAGGPLYDLHFQLLDDAGEPVAGETIEISKPTRRKAKTDETGHFFATGSSTTAKVTIIREDESEVEGVAVTNPCISVTPVNCDVPAGFLSYDIETDYYGGSLPYSSGCGAGVVAISGGVFNLEPNTVNNVTPEGNNNAGGMAIACPNNVLTLEPGSGAVLEITCGSGDVVRSSSPLDARKLATTKSINDQLAAKYALGSSSASAASQLNAQSASCPAPADSSMSAAAGAGIASAATLAVTGLVGAGVYLVKRGQDAKALAEATSERV